MNYKQIVERYAPYEEVILLEDREYYNEKEIFEKIELDIELEDNVIVVSKGPGSILAGVQDWPLYSQREREREIDS